MAARMKAVIRGLVVDVLTQLAPPPRYAEVISVNTTTRRATVSYPGEAVNFALPYGSAVPSVGSVVRVLGVSGARYIDDVVG